VKLREALAARGLSEEQVEDRLSRTFNDFEARLTEYSRTTGRRIPGPIVSMLPWINGVRLKCELGTTRQLRHKIVHEGLRLDHSMYSHLQRPMETMTWLFNWFRSGSPSPFSSMIKKYPLIASMHGDIASLSSLHFAHDYTADGVTLRRSAPGARSQAPEVDVVVVDGASRAMLLKAMGSEPADIETFAFTSLSRLGFRLAESAMPPAGS